MVIAEFTGGAFLKAMRSLLKNRRTEEFRQTHGGTGRMAAGSQANGERVPAIDGFVSDETVRNSP